MAIVALTTWFNDVLPDVPGCLEAVALDAILDAAVVFCERTKVHKADLAPITLQANTPATAFVAPVSAPQTRVSLILDAVYGTTSLSFRDPDWLRIHYDPIWRTKTGTPQFITQDDEDSFRVVPYLTTTATSLLNLFVALKPTATATDIEARLWREYREVIQAGALARLMMSPKKPYSNAILGAANNDMFESAIARIAHKAFKGHVRSRTRTKAHFM